MELPNLDPQDLAADIKQVEQQHFKLLQEVGVLWGNLEGVL